MAIVVRNATTRGCFIGGDGSPESSAWVSPRDKERMVRGLERAQARVNRGTGRALAVEKPSSVNAGLLAVALLVAFVVALLGLGFVGQMGSDESEAIRTELREQGFAVTVVERVATYRGNDGKDAVAPEGARVYRVAFRAADNRVKVAYRIAAGFLSDRWSFPDGR